MPDSSMLLAALFVGGIMYGFGWLVVWCYEHVIVEIEIDRADDHEGDEL